MPGNDRSLNERQLRAFLDVLLARHDDQPGDAMPSAVLDGLTRLIPCTSVTFLELDLGREAILTEQEVGDTSEIPDEVDEVDELERVFWAGYWNSPLCSYPDRTGDLRSVIKLSDFYSRRELHALARWADFHRPTGVEHEMLASLPAAPGQARRLLFVRGPGDPDFSEQERLALELLRPHLHAVWQDAQRRRAGVPALTPREWEVLHLVAAGQRNAEIAARLFISVTTVHMHLRNIFGKLGVHTRTAAVAAATPHSPTRTQSLH
jgi:DNA-binding CsgD family transcriptional regulator